MEEDGRFRLIFVDVTTFFHFFPYGFTPTPGVNYDKQRTEHFIVSDIWEIPHLAAHDVILRIIRLKQQRTSA